MKRNSAKLYGLILAGGKSTRMGQDKGLIDYHGRPQREYLYNLAAQHCDVVFYSVRKDQVASFPEGTALIIDKDHDQGPFNGIMSAHAHNQKAAWLVLASDLPLLNNAGVSKLVNNRDSRSYATTLVSRNSNLPEPLIAIWEPQGLAAARNTLENGQFLGPRKFLMDSEIKIVATESEEQTYNANTIKEYQFAKEKLNEA